MVTEKATDKISGLRDYELIIILKPESSEEAQNVILDNLSKLITSKGGTVSEVNRWGKKKLAYPIKHLLEGVYVLIRFQGKPALSREMESQIRISEEILRHLLIKVE